MGRSWIELGTARVLRAGDDVTVCALGAMVPKALDAADRLAGDGVSAEVIDVRSLVPLDVSTILDSVGKTSRLVTVEENPRLCGWGRRSRRSLPRKGSSRSTGRSFV